MINRLEYDAGTLFAEGIGLLRGEADEQTVFQLVFSYELHDVLDGFADRDSFDRRLATELFRRLTLLLQIRDDHIHNRQNTSLFLGVVTHSAH